MEKNVYLDNAAATRLDERVLEAMKKYFFEVYAVATSEFGYSLGIEAREALEEARGVIANKLGAEHDEIVFTSGSTESSNMAIKGVALALKEKKGKHIIVSKIEDFPVLNSAKSLEKQGFEITYLDVDQHGLVNFEQLENSIRNDTILVSIQHANQEIGTLQDINRIGNLCKQKGVLFHTDATHTFTRIPIDVKKIHANLITVSAHTIHGPKETGALFIRKNTPLTKWMDGGFQEFNKRAGLENIPGAVGFAKAVELVTQEENNKLQQFRDYLIKRVLTEIPNTTLNGHLEKRIPHNANITFHYVEGESITLHLDMRGFSVSTGSACFSKSLEASHVIMGIGGDHERAHGSVRFTFGRYNTMEDVNSVVDNISEVVEELRKISPLGKNS
ncbi:MAG: putative cysteine desulfurase 2 [Candidatus Methanofastidiosum methylothiophilum]|uniref:Putative cysteine desulfurase 2 n=1 Tax=Candidatus Methanofastidiosum methylothiophilum TaxID=1705564 RepID=A0A150J7I5_9EURY|nr:MAG: putative cysteine desulfurase 2 [Candidatus Methanofastidiosum methylthiophilus]